MYKELNIQNIKIFKNEEKLKIAPITLLYGENSSGKTTLLKVLQGFVRPNIGTILVDGRAFNTLDLENYRSQVSMVNTSPKFFAGSIPNTFLNPRFKKGFNATPSLLPISIM